MSTLTETEVEAMAKLSREPANPTTVLTETVQRLRELPPDRATPDPIVSVVALTEDGPEGDEGTAYWVTARVRATPDAKPLTVRLFAAPRRDGRPGLEPCGTFLDDWCDPALRTAYGDAMADAIGREAIASASLLLPR